MAVFEDPIRVLHVRLPSGWALDPFSSTLTQLFFAPWNRVDEILMVSVEPARVPAPATDEAWLAAVRDEVTATSDFLDLPSTSGRAVAAEIHAPSGSLERVALVRGPRVDFVLEHNGADSADPQPWATLSAAVLHISSAANTNPGPAFSTAQIHAAVQAGLQAMQAGDGAALLRSFADAVRMSTSSFLRTLTSFDEAAQVATAIEVARILSSFAYVTCQEILLLRDADQVMDRAGRSAAAIQSSAGQPLAQNVATGLSAIEAELRGPSRNSPGVAFRRSPIAPSGWPFTRWKRTSPALSNPRSPSPSPHSRICSPSRYSAGAALPRSRPIRRSGPQANEPGPRVFIRSSRFFIGVQPIVRTPMPPVTLRSC